MRGGRGSERMRDVIAVDIQSWTVRFMAQGLDERNAEAVKGLAMMRHGVDAEFFVVVDANIYATGDAYGAPEGRADLGAAKHVHAPNADDIEQGDDLGTDTRSLIMSCTDENCTAIAVVIVGVEDWDANT